MNTSNTDNSLKEQLDSLEASIARLLEICNTLSVENAAFKKSNHQLLIDRSDLHEKNDKARIQVEAMINRLKTIDNAS